MAKTQNLTGKYLNELWNVGATHALYREDGEWYHQLREFPGALFDANGYVFFNSEKDYLASPYLKIQQDLHVPDGIASMPNYIRITEQNQLQSISQSIKKVSEHNKTYKITKPAAPNIVVAPIGQYAPKRNLFQSERIIRDTKISFWVKYVHEYHCQICGTTLKISDGQFYAEAHHIKPLGNDHNGPDVVENILCVCPNHHALLDYAAILIEESRLHHVEGHEINLDYINYHNSVICKVS